MAVVGQIHVDASTENLLVTLFHLTMTDEIKPSGLGFHHGVDRAACWSESNSRME